MAATREDPKGGLKTLGANVRRWRLERGLSQERLADLARVSQSHVSALEIGEHEPGVLAVVRIAWALHVEPQDLLRGIR